MVGEIYAYILSSTEIRKDSYFSDIEFKLDFNTILFLSGRKKRERRGKIFT